MLTQLYNYSKEELKDILVEDHTLEASKKAPHLALQKQRSDKVIEVDIVEKEKKPISSFDLAYQYLLDAHNEGTYY